MWPRPSMAKRVSTSSTQRTISNPIAQVSISYSWTSECYVKPSQDLANPHSQMPEMSGVEVTCAVRRTGNPLYIVGCTGNALREDQEEYTGAGADQVLTKPVKQAALVEAIEMARRRVAGETVPRGFPKNGHQPFKNATV